MGGTYQTGRLRVALIDDDKKANQCVRAAVEERGDRWDLETCASLEEAVRNILIRRPDLVLMNVRLPDFPGIEYIERLTALLPSLHIIVVSTHCDAEIILLSLMAGAASYLLKPLRPKEVVQAISGGLRGLATFSPRASDAVMRHLRSAMAGLLPLLTERERQVLALLVDRSCDKVIASRLGITHVTVHVHLSRLYRKLGVHNRQEAVLKMVGLAPDANRRAR